MPLPTRVVTGSYVNAVTGEPLVGEVHLDPYPGVWHDIGDMAVRQAGHVVQLMDGAFSQPLVTTDAAGVDPVLGRMWRITERIAGPPVRSRFFALPAGDASPVDVTQLVVAEPGPLEYLPIVAGGGGTPTGPAGGALAGEYPNPTLSAADLIGRARVVYKSADGQVISSTTLQDDAHLALSVVEGGVYALDMYLDVEADLAADIAVGWSVPAGAVMSWTESSPSAGNSNNVASIKMNRLDQSATSQLGIIPAGTTAALRGVVRAGSTPGTVQFRWAQFALSATPTVLKAGTWLRLHRMA